MEHKIQRDVKQQCEEEYKKKLIELRNEMQEKHAKELETKIEAERKLITEQFDELTTIIKKTAEEEQVCLTFHCCAEQSFTIHWMELLYVKGLLQFIKHLDETLLQTEHNLPQ
jgi:hypothetical protein